MSILDTFFVLFEGDTSKLDKGLDGADKKSQSLIDRLRGVDGQASKTGASFVDLIGKTAALAGVGLSLGALVAGVKATAAEYTELGKLAAQFRATTEAVDGYIDATGLLGMSREESVGSLKALESAVQDTFLGLGRAKKVFEELGIEVKDASGKIKPTTEVMAELAEKFKGMERGTQMRVMERLGLDPALLKLFNSDLAALQKRMTDVDRASGFNLETAVKRAQEYTKASKEMSLELNTLKLYLSKLSESFKIAALPWFTMAMQKATEYVRAFLGFLMKHSHFVEGLMVAIGAAITYFVIPAAINGAIALWAMIAPFAIAAIAAVALAAAFALLYDDIVNFMEGNDSMLGDLLAKYPELGEAVREIGAAFGFVYDAAKALAFFLVDMWGNPGEAFATFQADLMDGLNALFARIPALKEAFDAVAGGIQTAGGVIVDVWDTVVAAVRLAIGAVTAGIEAVMGVVDRVRGALGMAPAGGAAAQGLAQGQQQLGAASASALSSTSSSAISNSSRGGDRNTSIGSMTVQTQATDAAGIASGIGGALGQQMRQANGQFDDGVAA